MATTILDAVTLSLDSIPANFAISAGSNRRAFMAVMYTHSSNAAPPTSATLGGQTMNVLATIDDDVNTFDACMTVFDLTETQIAAMSGSAFTVTGGTYGNRSVLYWSVQGATQGAITPATAATSGTSGSVSLTRVADSYTVGITLHDFTGTSFSGLADPSEAGESQANNTDIAYGYGTDTARTANFTWTHSTPRNNVTLALNIAPSASGPTISSTSDDTPTDGSTLTIDGSGFGASQGSGGVTAGGVGWTETSWSDTSIQVTVALGDNKYNTNVSLVVTDNSSNASSGHNVQIQPASGVSYVNLSGTPGTGDNAITAVPDLVGTEQLEISNVQGGTISDVTVTATATFSVTSGVTSFDVRANDGTWGAIGTQYINSALNRHYAVARSISGSIAAPINGAII